MNGTNSTRSGTFFRLLWLVAVLLFGSDTDVTAQTGSCACKSAIQVSVDQVCEASISAAAILATGSTCGGAEAALVTLMKTPTGDIISQGTGAALFTDGHLYIGKAIYGKVTNAAGTNSCWTTITIEDKMAPYWESNQPIDIVLTCPSASSYAPTAYDNCEVPRRYISNEIITLNDCKRPDIFRGPDTLKLIERYYLAEDASGNVSSTPCKVNLWVVALDANDLIPPANVQLQCDAQFATLPNGNPSPTPLVVNGVTLPGTGVPKLKPWLRATSGNGGVVFNPNTISMAGGSTGSGVPGLGSQICLTAQANGSIAFTWNASKSGGGNDYSADSIRYTINGSKTVVLAKSGSQSPVWGNVNISLKKNDVLCIQVFTDNAGDFAQLVLSNVNGSTDVMLPPDMANACNIYTTYTDTKYPALYCVTKVFRQWQVLEWSCESKITNYIQMIEIIDSKGPVISGLPDVDRISTNGNTCAGNYLLRKPVLADNCATELSYAVTYPGGYTGIIKLSDPAKVVSLPMGCNEVLYTAYDACQNKTEFSMLVVVEDNTSPVAICDQNTNIGLTLDGKALVPATSFDDGSYDECQVGKLLVRRMDQNGCTPCKTPEFPGFTFLGEFVNAGKTKPHYYYISKHKVSPHVAVKTASAMGGYVVALNNAAEHNWLYGKVQDWKLDENYLIGLRDGKRIGKFEWVSGEGSTYRNWASGDPKDVTDGYNSYDYVRVLDDTGKWDDFGTYQCDETDMLYVVEITDPCGFNSYVQFCCTDVNTTGHMVQFRVIDKAGNYNECMVSAFIQDKLAPSISCPVNMTVNCNGPWDLKNLTQYFGWPVATDNCTSNIRITTDSVISVNSCRIGTITRNFTATDPGGRSVKCSQHITIEGLESPFEMTANRWPRDVEMQGCEDPTDDAFGPDRLGRPDLSADNFCSLVGAEYDDEIYTFNNTSGESCFKILRRWTVVDWCQRINQQGGGHEYATWKHTQVIKVYDPEKPVITSSCAAKSVCTYDPECKDGYIELTASATDKCTRELRWYYKIDAFNNGSFDTGLSKSGNGNIMNASGEYPIGTHKIVWTFEDRCGNAASCEQLFTIDNCKAPTPYCINGLATSLMPVDTDNNGTPDAGMVEVWAKDFDNGSYHTCQYPVIFSFAPIKLDNNGKPVSQSSRTFTCDDIGKVDVQVYTGVVTPSGNLVQDHCNTFITIQDNFDACDEDNGRFTINGTVVTEANMPVSDVYVSLEGSEMNMITGKEGTYQFEDIKQGGNFMVKVNKDGDYLNGVSTLDLVMIQRHILGIEKLASPLKQIAADVKKDAKIAASDLIELRKLILGVHATLEDNTSWRFVDKSYQFQDPEHATAELFPEIYPVSELKSNMAIDFYSVKVGDVNGNASAGPGDVRTEPRASQLFALAIDNQSFQAGDKVVVPVRIQTPVSVAGFQFTFHYDTELFSLEEVNGAMPGMTDNHFGFKGIADGMLTMSYNQAQAMLLAKGDLVFEVVLRARDKGSLSEGVWIDSSLTPAEAYTEELSVMGVQLSVLNRASGEPVLYQNTPNPFKTVSRISFDLPADMTAKLTIYDVTGKTIQVYKQDFLKGFNSVEINKNDLGTAGVMYYTLEAGSFRATRKMVVIE